MLIREKSPSQRRSAFTLMEMLVVVAIIVALASIGGFFLIQALKDSTEDVARLQAKNLTNAAKTYWMKHNQNWPPNLELLLQKDNIGGPYIQNRDDLIDPWGNQYKYDPSGPMNQGLQPDIWADVPNSNGKRAGNWPKSAEMGGVSN
jgi:general secretion pathway protein G